MIYRKGGDPPVLDRVAGELMTCAGEVDGVRNAGTEAMTVIARSSHLAPSRGAQGPSAPRDGAVGQPSTARSTASRSAGCGGAT